VEAAAGGGAEGGSARQPSGGLLIQWSNQWQARYPKRGRRMSSWRGRTAALSRSRVRSQLALTRRHPGEGSRGDENGFPYADADFHQVSISSVRLIIRSLPTTSERRAKVRAIEKPDETLAIEATDGNFASGAPQIRRSTAMSSSFNAQGRATAERQTSSVASQALRSTFRTPRRI